MKWSDIKKDLADWLAKLFLLIVIITTICGFIYTCCRDKENTTPPVEEIQIDSLTKENDKLIIEVEHLDSIKDAKVIEVKSLDNDSTLKLFYQLIRK